MVFCLIKDNVFDSPVLCTPFPEPIGEGAVGRYPAGMTRFPCSAPSGSLCTCTGVAFLMPRVE